MTVREREREYKWMNKDKIFFHKYFFMEDAVWEISDPLPLKALLNITTYPSLIDNHCILATSFHLAKWW